MSQVVAVLLAAGTGTRMKSALHKVLHPVGGTPMIQWVVRTFQESGVDRVLVVVGYQAEQVRAVLDDVEFVWQAEQKGTGHATQQALPVVDPHDLVLVAYGDAPLLQPETVRQLIAQHRAQGAAGTLITARVADPTGYGRVLRGADGSVVGIVEEVECTPEERQITEINTGIGIFAADALAQALAQVQPSPKKGEYYLTDVPAILARQGQRVAAFVAPVAEEVLGINDRVQLAEAEARLRRRVLERLMREGVTVQDPASTYVSHEARVGRDTVLRPGTLIEGATVIGEGCDIGPHSQIVTSRIGRGVRVWQSVVERSEVGDDCRIGPFSHLRPGCQLGRGVEVGNFAELKQTRVGDGAKMHHHSYLGDATIGARTNVGAGVITVNYDGKQKHHTEIGEEAFLGCNVNLVAPVTVGQGAYVAAGSTINHDVPPGALGIARARQENKPEWVLKRLKGR